MNGFSTCRNAWLAAIALLVVSADAQAIDPERAMTQYLRDEWGSERGFPGGPVYAITQTADGYLWIAAEKGLVRFDGLTFRLFEPLAQTAGFGPTVLGVAPDPDGSLWARLRGPALVRYRDGVFENVLATVGQPESVATAMAAGKDGSIYVATLGHGAVVRRNGAFATVASAAAMPGSFVIAIAEAANGEVWLGTRDAGLVRVQGSRVTPIAAGLPDLKINCLLTGERGEVLIGTDAGIVRWSGSALTQQGVAPELTAVTALAMLRDRDANVWIAAGARGLLRVNGAGVASLDAAGQRARGNVTALFEDRDGNLWIGTTRGIERWRDAVFTSYGGAQGVEFEGAGPIYVDAARRTWFAPPQGGLFFVRDGQVTRVAEGGLDDDIVYSIGGSGTDVWVGRQRGGLTRLRAIGDRFAATSFTQANGLAQNSVYSVHQARDGAVWAGTLSGGVSRFKDGVFTTHTTAEGLTSNTVAAILETGDGTMWFGTPNGVSTLSRGGWRRYAVGDGLPANDVNSLFEDRAGIVWAGTAGGLAMFAQGQVQTTLRLPPSLRRSVLGIEEDRAGWLWIAASDRILRVNREALVNGSLAGNDVQEYGVADGLAGLEGVKRHRSAVADDRGRIWFSINHGMSMADPIRADEGAMPALVRVEELSADGAAIDPSDAMRVPAGRRRVVIGYAGLSLAVPERVLFRYRLDGFDRDWGEPVSERQAVYTNLAPGPYTFRVQASNSDGMWNGQEASVRFDVEPMIWQTGAFRVLAALLIVAAGWGLYRLRVMQMARRLNTRFEERLAERTRIAQELHDTLLQGFLSASMQLHVATDGLPADSPSKPRLVGVLDLMGRVIEEGRNAVRGLRSPSSAPDDLEQAFAGIQHELAMSDAEYRVIVDGSPRPLNPIIRDEIYRIGREALVNAFRHSGARSVEVELEFASSRLRLQVRDNGRGIDPQVLRTGTDGHWGLAGMRERAERIGGKLTVRSRAAAGTEVELSVPGNVAFSRAQKAGT